MRYMLIIGWKISNLFKLGVLCKFQLFYQTEEYMYKLNKSVDWASDIALVPLSYDKPYNIL